MNGDALTRVAERAGARYALLLEGLRGLLPLAGLTPWGEQARLALVERAYALAQDWLAEESNYLQAEVIAAGQQGLDSVTEDLDLAQQDLSPDAIEHLAELAEALDAALRVQIERDIALLAGALREIALRGAITARSRGVARAAVLAPLLSDAMSRMRFEFADRSGKRWPSQRHVKTLWRWSLLTAWNEVALLAMADHGLTQAVIDHPDENHAESGTVLSLTEQADGLLWADVRQEVFHPNSNAWVRVP